MRKLFTIIVVLLFALIANAELINYNPDPDGDPWYAGGLSPLTPEQQQFVQTIPLLELPSNYDYGKALESSIDNSTKPYFRDILLYKLITSE